MVYYTSLSFKSQSIKIRKLDYTGKNRPHRYNKTTLVFFSKNFIFMIIFLRAVIINSYIILWQNMVK